MTGNHDRDNNNETTDVIGCSVRGQKNVAGDIPCQDDNEQRRLSNRKYVIAAADGLGSARLSHVGSSVATQAVANHVEEALTGTESLDEGTLRSLLRESFVHVREQLHKEADSRGVPVSELNTTLLVAVGGPAGVGGAAVGDGGIVWHRGGQTDLLIPREDTEYGNVTIPVQSDSWTDSYRFGWMLDVDAAAVFSDGLDSVAWDGQASVSDELFDQVFNSIREFTDLDQLESFLREFLDGEAIRKSSSDDKTLVIGALPASQWTDPANVETQPSSIEDGRKGTSSGAGLESGRQSGGDSHRKTGANDQGTTTVEINEPSGDNGINPLVSVAGILVVVAVVLVAGALIGPLSNSGGGGATDINLTSAELKGSGSLVIEGHVTEGAINDSGNISVRVQKEGQPRKSNDDLIEEAPAVNNSGQFNLTLGPEKLPEQLANATENVELSKNDGNTQYIVVVETEDGTNTSRYLERIEPADFSVPISTNSPVAEDDTNETSVPVTEPANFTVTIAETNSPVIEGDTLNVTAILNNTGDETATQTIDLTLDGREVVDSTDETLNGGESSQITLQWATSKGNASDYAATVASEDSKNSTDITVNVSNAPGNDTAPTNVPSTNDDTTIVTMRYSDNQQPQYKVPESADGTVLVFQSVDRFGPAFQQSQVPPGGRALTEDTYATQQDGRSPMEGAI